MKRERAEQLAAFGAEFLDGVQQDWAHRIPDNFNIRFERECNLAHLYGSFSRGLFLLDMKQPHLLGLYVPGDQHDPAVIADYELLTDAWRWERVKRRVVITQREMEGEAQSVGAVGADG